MDCYEHCNDILKKFLDIEVSATQVFRVSITYGEQIGKDAVVERSLPLMKDVLYAEADGSMILTRDEESAHRTVVHQRLKLSGQR